MMDLYKLQEEILGEMAPLAALNAADAATIAAHRNFLLGIEDELVAGFYGALYAHPRTAEVFIEGERHRREESLRSWWRRTVDGPLDGDYWSWMALVGIAHIRRGVRNPMMLSMAAFIAEEVRSQAISAGLGPGEVDQLSTAFNHLAGTISAVISESYTQSYVSALQALGGLNPQLLANMLSIEIQAIEDTCRASLR